MLRDEGRDADSQLAPADPDVVAHGRLGDVRTALVSAALPDPPGGVTLLARSGLVGLEDLIDERLDGGRQFGCGPLCTLARRWDRGSERLAYGPPVHAAFARDGALGQAELVVFA